MPNALPALSRRALMEAFGTFALVFAGCGAAVANTKGNDALGLLGVSLVFGLIIMAMIYTGGHLSGAHFNPAVTIAFTAGRHFPAREAFVYVAAQVAGAILGALLLLALWPDKPADLGAVTPTVGVGAAFSYELVLTALLMFVITAVATDTRAVGTAAAIAVGGAVALGVMVGGPVTGGSMNPARSLGPALASGTWTDLWVYLTAPVLGATIGVLAYRIVRDEPAVGSA
jgi:aquaporin NIP